MATIPAKVTPVGPKFSSRGNLTVWENMRAGDVGESVGHAPHSTVQVTGDFDCAIVSIEGTNDDANWYATELVRAPGITDIPTSTVSIRPSVEGGERTLLTVTMFAPKEPK